MGDSRGFTTRNPAVKGVRLRALRPSICMASRAVDLHVGLCALYVLGEQDRDYIWSLIKPVWSHGDRSGGGAGNTAKGGNGAFMGLLFKAADLLWRMG